jgi:hypothetical protein
VKRASGAGYDEAMHVLCELREVADQWNESKAFHVHFGASVRPRLRRPAFVKRLQDLRFTLPEA